MCDRRQTAMKINPTCGDKNFCVTRRDSGWTLSLSLVERKKEKDEIPIDVLDIAQRFQDILLLARAITR